MINLDKAQPPAGDQLAADANAHFVQLASQLAVLEQMQADRPTLADYRLTGLLQSVREARDYARALAFGEHVSHTRR